jgi:transcriptional regulator with XRE-family HTH domain
MVPKEVITVFNWLGLGKKRSKFGKWLDNEGITQLELERRSKLSRGTISKLCNDDSYRPKHSTIASVKKALKQLGKNVPDDFFNM